MVQRLRYDGDMEEAMIELTKEQQRQIAETGWPPRATNPETQEVFVLLHEEMFERVCALLEAEDEIAAIEQMNALVAEVLQREDSASQEDA